MVNYKTKTCKSYLHVLNYSAQAAVAMAATLGSSLVRPLAPTNVAVEARVKVTLGSNRLVLAKSRLSVGRTVGYKALMVIGSAPGGGSDCCHLWVFGAQVRSTLDDVAVVRGGQHFAILKDAGGLADLDGTRFQDFNLVNDDLFGQTHF